MTTEAKPTVPGNWDRKTISNTGPWTVGTLWIDGEAKAMAMLVQDHHCNALGTMHGGAIATLLDGQLSPAVNLVANGSNHTPTISLSVDYLAPPRAGDWIVVEMSVIKTTRNMIFTQALARVGDTLVARSNAIYKNNLRKESQ